MKVFFFSTALICSSLLGMSAASAQNQNIEVTPIQEVTQHELAALHVLSDICPSLVKDQQQFEQGYEKFLSHFLPKTQNPLAQIKQLSQNSQFQPVLKEAYQDADLAGRAKNSEICQEISAYTP